MKKRLLKAELRRGSGSGEADLTSESSSSSSLSSRPSTAASRAPAQAAQAEESESSSDEDKDEGVCSLQQQLEKIANKMTDALKLLQLEADQSLGVVNSPSPPPSKDPGAHRRRTANPAGSQQLREAVPGDIDTSDSPRRRHTHYHHTSIPR